MLVDLISPAILSLTLIHYFRIFFITLFIRRVTVLLLLIIYIIFPLNLHHYVAYEHAQRDAYNPDNGVEYIGMCRLLMREEEVGEEFVVALPSRIHLIQFDSIFVTFADISQVMTAIDGLPVAIIGG